MLNFDIYSKRIETYFSPFVIFIASVWFWKYKKYGKFRRYSFKNIYSIQKNNRFNRKDNLAHVTCVA